MNSKSIHIRIFLEMFSLFQWPAVSRKSVVSTSFMVNRTTKLLAERNGLEICDVAREDTGRFNTSDMTLCVGEHLMPIIRKPNFTDVTSEQPMELFTVNVGNESNSVLKTITFGDYIANITKYTDVGVKGSLLTTHDTHILTSAQSCLLPLSVEFGVKLYNQKGVLVIIASAQGTSTHLLMGHGDILCFNKGRKMAHFVAECLQCDKSMTEDEKQRNRIMIYQIPLVCNPSIDKYSYTFYGRGEKLDECCDKGMDHAAISTGVGFGSFPSLSEWTIERDKDLPIRCTVQYYHVTDIATITEFEMKQIAKEITNYDVSIDVEESRFGRYVRTLGSMFGLL